MSAGLHGLTRAIAVDHKDGVRCNANVPGWIDTELNTAFIESLGDPTSSAKIGGIHPIGRTGQPEEIAGLACWLLSMRLFHHRSGLDRRWGPDEQAKPALDTTQSPRIAGTTHVSPASP